MPITATRLYTRQVVEVGTVILQQLDHAAIAVMVKLIQDGIQPTDRLELIGAVEESQRHGGDWVTFTASPYSIVLGGQRDAKPSKLLWWVLNATTMHGERVALWFPQQPALCDYGYALAFGRT